MLSGNLFLSMLASGGGLSYGSPAAASDRPSRLILIWLYLYVATHVSPTSHDSLFRKLKTKKALISQLGPFPIKLSRLKRIGPVQAPRLYSSIPAATHDPIGTISAPPSR